jgi:hypothetical protein
VIVASDFYRKDAKFISQDELDFKKQAAPLPIDEIKDIDSLLAAIEERAVYAGNKFLGKSENLTDADTCTDAVHVYRSHNITGARYVAYSSYVRYGSEYVFGSGWFLRSKYLIRCLGADNLTRSFECYICPGCSDAFFGFNNWASSHIMFSFNQRSKHYCLGNNELPKDKYFVLREKLIAESREYIEKHKTFPSLFEPAPMDPKHRARLLAKAPKRKREPEDLKPIDDAFKSTSRIIFGTEIGTMEQNHNLLAERATIPQKTTTFFGNPTYFSPVFFFNQVPKDRMICKEEEALAAAQKIDVADDDLAAVMKKIGNIAFYRIDMDEGHVSNLINTPIAYHGINALYVCDLTYGKNCAYCTYGLNDEAVFGCFRTIHSKYSIRCESCYNVTGCFELDACSNCSNSMFCHNCEGLDNCLFCFNTKSLRYAVGNVEVGREEFLRIKKLVISAVLDGIKKDGKIPFDIFDLRKR